MMPPDAKRDPVGGPVRNVLLTGENTPQDITFGAAPCVLACSPSCCTCPRLLADAVIELVAGMVLR